MVKFKSMDEFTYDSEDRTLTHNESGIIYRDYLGLGRVVQVGQSKLISKLTDRFGEKRARIIQQNSISRGNSIHKKLQDLNLDLFPEIGESVCRDVFLYSRLLDNKPPVQGSLDDLRLDKNDNYHIIEYKTKSSVHAWRKYRNNSLPDYYKQVAAYDALLTKFLGIRAKSVNIAILFPATGEDTELITVSRLTLKTYYRQFLDNLKQF